MANWSVPQRQSALGIFMFAGKAFREVVAIFLVTTGSLINKGKPFKSFALLYGCIAVYIFGKAFLEYFFFTFHILENQLIVKKGIFSKKTLVIPFGRIQTVQLHQNLLHKLIGHCKVAIDTAGTDKSEVVIQSLAYNKAVLLKEALTQQITGTVDVSHQENQNTISLAAGDLFKMAVSANHLETFGLIIAFVLARFNDVKDLLGIDAYDYMEEHGKEVTFTAQMTGIIIFFTLLFAMVISVLRIILKYSDLAIRLDAKGFHLKHGLLNSQQQFIGARKIQYVLWKANWIRRKIGLYMFHVKTAGEDDLKKKQRIHVPVTKAEHLHILAAYYQAALPSHQGEANNIHASYVYRRVLLIGLPVTIIAIAVAFIWWQWYALWIGVWLIYFIITDIIYRNNFRFWVSEEAIEISKGVWGREKLVLNWQKLQIVTVRQNIYQRKNNLANLSLITASGAVNIPYIREDAARFLADFAAMKTESSQKNWM